MRSNSGNGIIWLILLMFLLTGVPYIMILVGLIIVLTMLFGAFSSGPTKTTQVSEVQKKPRFSKRYSNSDYRWLLNRYEELVVQHTRPDEAVGQAENDLYKRKMLEQHELEKRQREADRANAEKNERFRKKQEEEKAAHNKLIARLIAVEDKLRAVKSGEVLADTIYIDGLAAEKQSILSALLPINKNVALDGKDYTIANKNGNLYLRVKRTKMAN